jgi:DNA end-binding protein Ku
VRQPEFGDAEGHADPDMVAVAKTIIERRTAEFDPADFHDGYQEALRQLVESKAEGRPATKKTAAAAPKVINLMEALKRSLAEGGAKAAPKAKGAADRRQGHMLLPVEGGKAKPAAPAAKPRAVQSKARKKAS